MLPVGYTPEGFKLAICPQLGRVVDDSKGTDLFCTLASHEVMNLVTP